MRSRLKAPLYEERENRLKIILDYLREAVKLRNEEEILSIYKTLEELHIEDLPAEILDEHDKLIDEGNDILYN